MQEKRINGKPLPLRVQRDPCKDENAVKRMPSCDEPLLFPACRTARLKGTVCAGRINGKDTPPRRQKEGPKTRLRTEEPVFAQPQPSPDPTTFKNPVTDQNYTEIANLEPVPQPVDGAVEPILTLAQTYGSAGEAKVTAIQQAKQIVFHSVGDTGSVIGPDTQSLVADKMISDFDEENSADVPSFFFHLGDVVYYFGEAQYYYDQFYEPFRNYPAPIVAIPGNHDGVVYAADPAPTLQAFLQNFCAASFAPSPDEGGLLRTTMIQPGVYFTFDAPFVRILGLYSNVLEDPGVISSQGGTNSLDDRQITFLTTALKRVKSENYTGAVIIAVHHPPFTADSTHGGSPQMLADIDSACTAASVWPHAVFSGHAHNYQRYTRTVNGMQIPLSRRWMRRAFPAVQLCEERIARPTRLTTR